MLTAKQFIIGPASNKPVAVIVDYNEWVRVNSEEVIPPNNSHSLLNQAQKRKRLVSNLQWEGGDGLAYQEKIRSEW